MSQGENEKTCPICKSTSFYTESGFFFCTQCLTQLEDANERVFEAQFDTTTRVRKIKLRKEKSEKEIVGWTSWELYNFILLGMTNELIEIGADPSIKLTVLQLWTYYLAKLEVAFTSKNKKCVPKMARRYRKKDAEIIYGKIQKKKKQRRKKTGSASGTSVISSYASSGSSRRDLNRSQRLLLADHNQRAKSQQSSDTDANSSMNQSLQSLKSSFSQSSSKKIRIRFNKKARLEAKKIKERSKKIPFVKRANYKLKYVTIQYATGPDVLTPMKLWSILYLALRIHNQTIYLSDMLRFSREGHLTYYKLDNLIPPEVTLTKTDIHFLTQNTDITHQSLRRTVARLAKFLNVHELPKPDILGLIKRYCEDLELPRGVLLYTERLYLSSPSDMSFTAKSSLIPNYEGRAMAYIIVVLKVLFGLDDITEKEISRVVDKINRLVKEKDLSTANLFSFSEWQRFVECRKSILASVHFPSKIKYDPECANTAHLYLRFMGLLKSRREAEPAEIESKNRVLSRALIDAFYQCVDGLNDNTIPLREMEIFPPSLTPLRAYVAQLDENSHCDVPYVLRTNFYDTKVGYMTKTDTLVELASHCEVTLKIVDNSLRYLEKIVPTFEQPKLPSIKELSEPVKLEGLGPDAKRTRQRSELLLDYAHRNRACKLKVNDDSLRLYSVVCKKILEFDETLDFEEDSGFDRVLPDGRLNIKDDSSDEDEDVKDTRLDETEADRIFAVNEQFFKERNIKLYDHEVESLYNLKRPLTLKDKMFRYRNEKGKFVKPTESVKKEYKRILRCPTEDSSGDDVKPKTRVRRKKKSKKTVEEEEIEEVPIDCFDSSESDLSILDEDVTFVNETKFDDLSISDKEILLRPYKNYWMYHCNFSRVKGKQFDLLEKELPENFVWLLNECAGIVEMTSGDLYEEVCLIEAYHLNVLKSKKSKEDKVYEFSDCSSKSYVRNIMSKW